MNAQRSLLTVSLIDVLDKSGEVYLIYAFKSVEIRAVTVSTKARYCCIGADKRSDFMWKFILMTHGTVTAYDQTSVVKDLSKLDFSPHLYPVLHGA